jgi:sulfite dehydrogenase (cytochrome) subunit B
MMKKMMMVLSVLALTPLVGAKTIELPSDTVLWRQSDLPGYQLVLQKCSVCHSAHYAEYQPPNSKTGYWNAQVLKMKKVFNAPIADEEIPVIVEYLNAVYGSNRK